MATQKSKSTQRPDRRPARANYWASGRLGKRKIANLMKHNGFASVAEASVHWHGVRTRHV